MATGYAPNNTVVIVGYGVPADSLFLSTPPDGQQWIDELTGRLYVRLKGNWTDVVALSSPSLLTAPSIAAVAESFDRLLASDDLSTTTLFGGAGGGTLAVVQLQLPVGALVSNLSFISGATPANGPTHQWAVLLDSARTVQAVSADATNTAIAADSPVTYAMGAAYRVAKAGPWFAGIMQTASVAVASVMGTLDARVGPSTAAPVAAATSSAGQTGPPLLGATMGAYTAIAAKMWIGVS